MSMTADLPVNEDRRLHALRLFEILDTPPDATFDRITSLASKIFSVPIVLVTFVDHDRIWFKSRHGLREVGQVGRDPGLCASAILSEDVYVVEDATSDARTLDHPLVAGSFGLRFHAGAPLRTPDRCGLGTICLMDKRRRSLDADQEEMLNDLASLVVNELMLRLSARLAARDGARRIGELEREIAGSHVMARRHRATSFDVREEQ